MRKKVFVSSSISVIVLLALRYWPHENFQTSLPLSQQVLASDGQLLRLTLAADQQYRIWTPLDAVAPTMVEAILLKEDRFFYWHPGINPIALLRAAWSSYVGGDQQGASTVTMQLARRWYHINSRSPLGKLKQMAAAFWLELRFSKKSILEAYLNLVPMGGNIEGVGAGSLIYFERPAQDLSLVESLTLAVLPQDPVRRANFGDALQAARVQLAKRWSATHALNPHEENLLELAVPGRTRQQIPFRAPHAAEYLLAQYPQQQEIRSTIQLPLQTLLENQIQAFVRERRNRDIRNASALLVDMRDMSVRALVGSANYFDETIAGQVNGVRAKRSPGSTLKPFLYGLALDQGLIHPLSILKDAPTAFGPFQPENFDGVFVGPIAAQDALVRSRNIPAVALAMQLREPSLYGLLKMAGVSRLLAEDHYGLALTLGGGEVTMEELIALYAMLANQGVWQPLNYTQSDASQAQSRALKQPLLSPEAAFMVIDMLSRNPRPDQSVLSNQTHDQRWTNAWKTGTSWGFRDAWTAGLVGHYALVIWVGHFDGKSNPAFVGIESAAPLYFRIADALALNLPKEKNRINRPPENVTQMDVCKASGDLPNQWCPQTEATWFIPGKSPIRVSTLHRPVVIDKRTGKAACPPYDKSSTYTDIFEFWPSEIFKQFALAGIPRRQPPVSDCANLTDGDARDYPVINQPLAGVSYTLRLSKPEESIPLEARVAADVDKVFWFADKNFIGNAKPQEALAWRPQKAGAYTATAVDDHGRSVSRSLRVEFLP